MTGYDEDNTGDENTITQLAKEKRSLAAQLHAKDTRIAELECQIQRLGRLAFMDSHPVDAIIDHFVAWGDGAFADLQAKKARIAELGRKLQDEIADTNNYIRLLHASEDRVKKQAALIEELEAFRLAVARALQRPEKCSIKGLTMYAEEDIRWLQKEHAKQAAYIENLEDAYLKTYASKQHAVCHRDELNHGLVYECAEERDQWMEIAREALEELRK